MNSGVQGPMQRTHLENEIAPEAVDLMMAVTENYYPLAQEYFQVKACLLGIPKLKNSDIYAPLPADTGRFPARGERSSPRLFRTVSPALRPDAASSLKKMVDAKIAKGNTAGLSAPVSPLPFTPTFS